MDPTGSATAAHGRDTFDSTRSGRENDALLGWGRSSDASNMIPSTVGRGKGGSKLTGGSGERGGTAKYTEGPLGSGARSRMASYDSATTLGLSRRVSSRVRLESWEFPGWGSHFTMISPPGLATSDDKAHEAHEKLGEWHATAISGNDILSSVLYVTGLVTGFAGWLSPLCLLMVAGILYLYRFIYGEAISALPMNGGAYNVLINTTSKPAASFAACLAVISYIATGVVSAATAISYLQTLVPAAGLMACTIGLLFFFACLMTMGISESAGVALGMFVVHVFTLTAVCVLSALYAFFNVTILKENLQQDFPDVMVGGTVVAGTWYTAILFGVSSAMLGVSGFESSSQFVEEQAKGVFVKTLRNMQWGVAVFNPAICLLSLCVLPMEEIIQYKHSMLAIMAKRVGYWLGSCLGLPTPGLDLGEVFAFWVSLDAFVVLSGAVLTAYVGISGLLARMAKDRCLPQFILRKNEWRGTHHYIIFGFFLLATSQVLILQGDIATLAGVYTFSFLGVMTLFSVGTLLLKFKRPSLPREVTVSYGTTLVGITCVITAFIGNMLSKPEVVSWFLIYFMAVGFVVVLVFLRVRLLKIMLKFAGPVCLDSVTSSIKEQLHELQDEPYVFFCKQADTYVINKAILYVRDNEHTNRLIVVHCSNDVEGGTIKALSKHIEMFDTMYPKIKISLLTVTGTFSPGLIDWLSKELGVLKNKFFITCLDSVFKYKIQELGGVRVITH
eukprot:g3901.t1